MATQGTTGDAQLRVGGGKGTRAVVRLPGIDDTIVNDAEGLASKIRLGR
jgi:hypothetical protein